MCFPGRASELDNRSLIDSVLSVALGLPLACVFRDTVYHGLSGFLRWLQIFAVGNHSVGYN